MVGRSGVVRESEAASTAVVAAGTGGAGLDWAALAKEVSCWEGWCDVGGVEDGVGEMK